MKIHLSQLLDVEKPLSELMEQPLPLKISYKLSKVLRMASEEMKEFYRLREDLFRKLGVSDPNENDKLIIPEDKKEQFTKEILELADIDVNMDGFEPISISEFDNSDVKMTPKQLAALGDFFKD